MTIGKPYRAPYSLRYRAASGSLRLYRDVSQPAGGLARLGCTRLGSPGIFG
jgi:hypothetical protein